MKLFLALLIMAFGASAAIGEVYTWKDKKGTVFYTNSLHEIPARYLNKARVLDVATGKKGGPATAQSGTPTAPAQPGQTPSPQPRPFAAQPPVPVPPMPAPSAPAVANPGVEPAPAATAASRSQQRSVTGEQRRQNRRRSSSSEE